MPFVNVPIKDVAVNDGNGNQITSTNNGGKQSLDVNITGGGGSTSSSISTQINFSSSLSVQTILSTNTARKGYSVYNNTTEKCYLLNGAGTPSLTNFTVILYPEDYYEDPYNFTGTVKAIWTVVGTGQLSVVEYT